MKIDTIAETTTLIMTATISGSIFEIDETDILGALVAQPHFYKYSTSRLDLHKGISRMSQPRSCRLTVALRSAAINLKLSINGLLQSVAPQLLGCK